MTEAPRRTLWGSIPLLLLFLSLGAYVLPWSSSVINSLSLGAYDLAEWSQPLPQARFLLRLQLTLITLLFALVYRPSNLWQRTLWTGVIIILIVTQLPPLDFITRLNDTNQQQQFTLALTTFIGSFVVIWVSNVRMRLIIILFIVAVGIMTSIVGELQATSLMQQYQPQTTWGIGFPLFIISYLLWGVWGYVWRKQTGSLSSDPV